ncbi:MAG TPA: ice-binding family protein [Ilumatobacteraceae bacterium]
MKRTTAPRPAAPSHIHGMRVLRRMTPVLAVTFTALLAFTQTASAGIVATVQLATAANYSVLGATTVTNTNPSVLAQSVGVSPGSSIVGFPPGIVLAPGTIEAANAATLQGQNDLTAAYVDAAGRSVEFTQTNPDLVGQTLIPGVYAATAKAPLGLSGQLVLDGQNNPNAVFIFQTDSTLITGTGSTIALINGASECNVFWQVGSSATLGSGSVFVGNILALTSITVESGVTVHGRALAQTGAVTLDNDVFTQPSCTPTTETTPPTTTAAPAAPTTTAVAPTTIATATTTSPVSGRSLPRTGTAIGSTPIFGGLFVALGLLAVFACRRRAA